MKPTKEELNKYSIDIAAKKYCVSTRTIRRWLEGYKIYHPRKGYGPGKLDMKKAAEIRRLYRSEFTQTQLADMFGVTQAMICKIINNTAYRVDLTLSGKAIIRKDS